MINSKINSTDFETMALLLRRQLSEMELSGKIKSNEAYRIIAQDRKYYCKY